jgi:hypothetical protein
MDRAIAIGEAPVADVVDTGFAAENERTRAKNLFALCDVLGDKESAAGAFDVRAAYAERYSLVSDLAQNEIAEMRPLVDR